MKLGIIGSGIVGLTLAYEITNHNSNDEIIIFEKEDSSLRHGTGRNSGVIHSGIYYTPNSLRSKLCIEGSKLMKKFIQENNLFINQCGKLLIPRKQKDLSNLDLLFERSKEVGVEAIKLYSKEEILSIEPNCNPIFDQALFIKSTSLADPNEVSNKLIEILNQRKVSILYQHEVKTLNSQKGTIKAKENLYEFDLIINAAGLYANHIGKISNLKSNFTTLPFKGKYWSIKTDNRDALPKILLYPVPDLKHPF